MIDPLTKIENDLTEVSAAIERARKAKNGDEVAGALIGALRRVLNAFDEASGPLARQRLQKALFKAERQLFDQGDQIRSMDAFELQHAAKMGLVAQNVADEELARRRDTFSRVPAVRNDGGAVVGGYLPCGYAHCDLRVDAAVGYCAEHKPPEPRVIVDARNLTAINLDEALEDAERRLADARKANERAEVEVAALRARIEVLDRSRGKAGAATNEPAE